MSDREYAASLRRDELREADRDRLVGRSSLDRPHGRPEDVPERHEVEGQR